jgi:hypothetical protein
MPSSILTIIQTQLAFYGYPIFMVLGNIGNTFVVILFYRQRQTACSIYLISSAIMNIIYLTIYGFGQIFPISYNDGTIRALLVCKLYIYIFIVVGQVAKTMLVLACIDRFLITSKRASFRAFSTSKKAKYLLFFSIIFWFLISVHMPIMITIMNGQCGRFGVYATIFSIFSTIFIGLIPSITLSVFGYLSYRHVRQMHNRIQPIVHDRNDANNSIRRRDRDLLVLVISEVVVYVMTTALYPLILLEMMISQYIIPNKSFQYFQTEIFILNIAVLLLFINSAAPFYTYLISSKSFRRDFQQLIINIYQKLRRQTRVQVVPRTDHSLTQRDTRV